MRIGTVAMLLKNKYIGHLSDIIRTKSFIFTSVEVRRFGHLSDIIRTKREVAT